MSSSITETTQLIAAMAQEHITDVIVSAVKGKASKMKPKQETISFADEILACFNMQKFAEEAAKNLERLFNRKFDLDNDSEQDDALFKKKLDKQEPPAAAPKKSRAKKSNDETTDETDVIPAKCKNPRAKKAKATTESVAEPVAEPVTEPVAEPVTEPVAEPVAEPVKVKKPRAKKSQKVVEASEEVVDVAASEEPVTIAVSEEPVALAKEPTKKSKKVVSNKEPLAVVDNTTKPVKSKVKKVTIASEESTEIVESQPKEKKVKSKPTKKNVESESQTFVENSSIEEEPIHQSTPILNLLDIIEEDSIQTDDFRIVPLNITNELEEDMLSEISECN